MVETLLEVRQLSKTFRYRTGWFHRQTVEAVKPLSFTLRERQTLAIIGENGSGKSTLAKDITRYEMRMLFCRVSTMANSTQKKSKMQLLLKHIFTEPIGIID